MIGLHEAGNIFVTSVRDGFVQVSAFVAITVLIFSYIQYRTGGWIVDYLKRNRKLQPVAGALLGLTPGCGGAILAMPLYIRGTVSFGTVVATLAATAGDSAFVILALAPEAALYAYAMAFLAGITFGYLIDYWGLGIDRIDQAIERITRPGGAEFATASVAGSAQYSVSGGPIATERASMSIVADRSSIGILSNRPSIADHGRSDSHLSAHSTGAGSSAMTTISHVLLGIWWVVGIAGLIAGILYLVKGAPDVAFEFAPTFNGVFTVAGLTGTVLSFYLFFVGRRYIGHGETGRIRDSFASAYETLQHAAMETSTVTVWVISAYLIYEYAVAIFSLDINALVAAAGILAPLAGAVLGLVPGCAPQIVFAGIYANGGIPFSALTANAISQDGDALFPLMAIDMKAAIIATIYTTIPAIIVGIGLYYFWPFADFGFGVLR